MKPHRNAEPIHEYYAKELDIEAALTSISCPIRIFLTHKSVACRGHIGPYRMERIFTLLEDLHFYKSFNASSNSHAIATIARISYLIVKSLFCSKHKAEDYQEYSQPLYDQIYSSALDCKIFQCYDGRDWDREFRSITGIMQRNTKRAREEEGEGEENEMIQPSALKKLRPSTTANSSALSSNGSTDEGDIVCPPSDDPFWNNLPWPSTDPLWQQQQQSSVNIDTVTSLHGGDALLGGNKVQQMKSDTHWWLTPLPPRPSGDDTLKAHRLILPNDGFQPSAMMTMTDCQASPSVEKLARINAHVGSSSSSSSMGSNVDPVTSQQQRGVSIEGNEFMHFNDINFDDMTFNDMTFNFTETNFNGMSHSDTWLDPFLHQSNALSVTNTSTQQPLQPDIAGTSKVSSTENSSAANSEPASSQATTPNLFTDKAADDLLKELFPDAD
ncbi:unnamed protein product [Zymoseptoria tritici ST99CH_3D7]|uniref:Uncharacterized protein n=1 Tax=Zymoseptoria tritici (strain ST99CH_3D7) TaxID=1276538 RepID=A0A1X7S9V2_ZYMT9|nr:unnamed protein product [Zymoseptoria tritici ST99CH_3D7]